MRAVGRLATTSVGPTTAAKQVLFLPSSSFSSGGGGGGGGRGGGTGRGRGTSSPFSSPVPGDSGSAGDKNDATTEAESASAPPGLGRGQGRGKPLPPPPLGNAFSPWMQSPPPASSAGRGRPQPSPSPLPDSAPKAPIFFRRFDDADSDSAPNTRGAGRGQAARPPPAETYYRAPDVFHRANAEPEPAQSTGSVQASRAGVLPQSILKGMHGAGRGKTVKTTETDIQAREENRHIRRGGRQSGAPSAPRLSSEGRGGRGVSRFGEGGRGRGGGGRGRDREEPPRGRRGRGSRRPDIEAQEEDPGLLLGSERFDENKLREKLGEKNLSRLKEVVDEICDSVFHDDEYLDAIDTNFSIEFEPEYAMEEFGTNPDIDDTPPIPLRDALEKMKPFLVAYEGIQSQEEWEQIVEETMAKVPYFKQMIDMYAGPDRMTAKQEQEELEKVSLTLPEDVPSSVKRFTDRALLTLQSNPGWGFDKKYQFMDKLVREATQPMKW